MGQEELQRPFAETVVLMHAGGRPTRDEGVGPEIEKSSHQLASIRQLGSSEAQRSVPADD